MAKLLSKICIFIIIIGLCLVLTSSQNNCNNCEEKRSRLIAEYDIKLQESELKIKTPSNDLEACQIELTKNEIGVESK